MTRSPLTLRKRCKNLTNEERLHLFQTLLKEEFNGRKLNHGAIKKYAQLYSLNTKTVANIWKLGSDFIANGGLLDVSNKRPKKVGRKRIELDQEKVKDVDLRCRNTQAGLANVLGMSQTTVHRRYKEGHLRRHSNAIKPKLTEQNKKGRLDFCMSMIDGVSLDGYQLKMSFAGMFDHVMIDEKWFNMSKDAEHYYLTFDEDEPYRSCQSKKFITKVMFLAAVARPRFDKDGNCLFDGKIGIFPFVVTEGAKRSSKNHPAGTMQTKPILSVTKDVTWDWLINKVLPAIREKWPEESRNSPIFIQQDNAKPHVDPSDSEFVKASQTAGFDIRLKFQPPNSPEFNVLDLGFFRAIQALQYKEAPRTVDELVATVEKSFIDLSPKSLNRVFLTLQQCMIESIKVKGGNNFKIPHMKKGKLEKEGRLPLSLACDYEIVEQAVSPSELAETWMARRLENLKL